MATVDLSGYSTQLIRDLIRTAEYALTVYSRAIQKCENCRNAKEAEYYRGMKHAANLRLSAYRQEMIRRGE